MNWGSTGLNIPRLRPEVRPSLFGDNVPSRDITTAGRISAISPDLKNPTVTFVKVGGQVVARVPFIEVDRLGLRVGATWSSMLAKSCEVVWMQFESKDTCVKLLAIKERTTQELTIKLKGKGVPADIITKVMEELTRDGLLNEARAAEQIVASEAKKGSSSAKVAAKLKAAGVRESAVREVKTTTLAKPDRKLAKEAAKQCALKLDGRLAKATKWRRVMASLSRKGFDEETARAAAASVLGPEPE